MLCTILVLTTLKTFAVSTDTDSLVKGINFELHLIQKFNEGHYECMAVGISVINKSGHDVYMPNLYFELLSRLSLYKKTNDSSYDQKLKNIYNFTIDTVHLMRNYVMPTNAINKIVAKRVYISENGGYLTTKIDSISDKAFTIILRDCNSILPFIKDGATLQDFMVFDIDWLAKEKGEYRICLEQTGNNAGATLSGSCNLPNILYSYRKERSLSSYHAEPLYISIW
ncbi:hypothetical protein [Pedobacter sp. L105]|uniref:hypothetical protein n=1 Tax=Pedobacter sp. L105 TaxID=1641871 RepID=UPI00131AE86C|nr:hypothetical protein [Pedobacter sp. L105]